ncbi:NAD-dependent epimerase/dehydratase family protein [Marinomonas epiphytica]
MKAFNKPVLITGHKGKTGSRVASYLANQGIETRCTSRSSSTTFDW